MHYKIAIIDDNPEDIYTIKRLLLKTDSVYDYVFFEFTNPEDALIELAKNTIDCIFLDYNFPLMNGLEFIQKFRNIQNFDTPIIFLTGQGNEKIAVESFKHGAFDYILKRDITGALLKKLIIKGIEKRDFERTEKTYNEFIKTMLDIIPAPIYYKNREGIYLGCNRAFEDFVNKSKEDIVGKTSFDLTNKSDSKKLQEMDKQLFENSGTQTFEHEFENDTNEKQYVVFNKVTYNNSLGNVDGIIGIVNDITDIKIREKELSGKTFIDSLTGILNRRYFDENIENEWKKCIREKKPMSLIMIDVDFFKRYNDNYGHLAGDTCLKKIAEEIRLSLLRPFDIVARYGGEEFVAILPDTNTKYAFHVAERIKENIMNLAIENKASPIDGIVTVSQGIAEINSRNDTVYKCLINADKSLYQAKKNGRNAIEAIE